jgi:uncharacterized protein
MEKYRLADSRLISTSGHDFLFLAGENAIFEVGPATKGLLVSWPPQQEFAKGEILLRLNGSPQEREEFLMDLLQRRLLIPSPASNRGRTIPKTEQKALPLKTLVLHVTDSCNLACTYCYQSSQGRPSKSTEAMSPEVARRSVDFLFDHSGNLEEVVLVFFGGEPLLNFKLIAPLVEYASTKASSNQKKITFSITTNGTRLTPEIIQFIEQKQICVTVSIDGPEEVHDLHRRFPDGSPSYKMILPNLRNLLRAQTGRPVVARVTLVKDADMVPLIFDHLRDLGFAEVGFAPITTEDFAYQIKKDGMDKLLEHFRNLAERFLQTAVKGDFFGFSNLIDLLVNLHQGEILSHPCGAGLALFSVAPRGELYICQRFTGKDQFRMGDIFSGFSQDTIETFRAETEVSQKEGCQSCWARCTCAGGCYYEAWVRQGSAFKPNAQYCEWIRKWLDIGLNVYCNLALNNPEYLDRLSLMRGYKTIC